MEAIKELDTVAVLKDIPEKNLLRGNVGIVIADVSNTKAEVEFIDKNGKITSLVTLNKKDLLRLRVETVTA